MEVRCDNKKYKIVIPKHLMESRETLKGIAKHHRGFHLNENRFKQILTTALYAGLTAYRNRGVTVITFFDENNKPFGVLVDLKTEDIIYVITVFRGPYNMSFHKCFVKVHNRIHLNKYILKSLTKEEKMKSRLQKINYDTEKLLKEELHKG